MTWNNGSLYSSSLTEYTYDTNNNLLSSEYKRYDTSTEVWTNSNRTEYIYDSNNLLQEETTKYWDSDNQTWVNNEHYIYGFTGTELTSVIAEEWDAENSVWVSAYKSTQTYNSAGYITKTVDEYWSVDDQQWIYYQQNTFTFDANYNVLDILTENWNTTSSDWDSVNVNTFTYDENNKELTYLYETYVSWYDEWWKDRGTHTYDASGFRIESYAETWDEDSLYWYGTSRHFYTNDANGNMLTDIYQYYESYYDNEWKYSSRHVYTYNANNKMLSDTEQDYNYSAQSWEDDERRRMEYASNGEMNYGIAELKSGDNWVLWSEYFDLPGISYDVNCSQVFIYYTGLTGISNEKNEIVKSFSLEQNYPNPFNPQTTIKYTIAKAADIKLAVYNVLGQEISVLVNKQLQAGEYEVVFDATQFSSGVYFYKMTSGSEHQVHRMLLIK